MTIKLPFGTLEWQLEENDIKQLPKEPSQDSIKYSDLSLGRAPPKSFFFSFSDKDSTVISIFSLSSLSLELWAEKYWLWMLSMWQKKTNGFGALKYERRGFWVSRLLRKIPWRSAWQPTPVFLLGESHGQRSLVGYTVHGVAKSQTWLKQFSTCTHDVIH